MSHYITILTEPEYEMIQAKRVAECRRKQDEAEAKYLYSPEMTKELLAQRNIPKELKSLKRRQWGYFVALIALGGLLWHVPAEKSKSIALKVGAVASFAAACVSLRKMTTKVLDKEEELYYAENGQINPRLELIRHEGRSYT